MWMKEKGEWINGKHSQRMNESKNEERVQKWMKENEDVFIH